MDAKQREHVGRVVMVSRIIVFSLVMGVMVFAAVAIFLGADKQAEAPQGALGNLQTTLAAGMALVALVASGLVPRLISKRVRESLAAGDTSGLNPMAAQTMEELGEVGTLAAVYQTTLIVGVAILEGAAFYNLVAYILEHQTTSLLFTALLLVAMFFKFPSQARVETWIADEQKNIDELRSLQV